MLEALYIFITLLLSSISISIPSFSLGDFIREVLRRKEDLDFHLFLWCCSSAVARVATKVIHIMSLIISSLPSKNNIHSLNLLSSHGGRNRMKNSSRRLHLSRSNHGGRFFAIQGMQWGIMGCQVSSTVMHAVM